MSQETGESAWFVFSNKGRFHALISPSAPDLETVYLGLSPGMHLQTQIIGPLKCYGFRVNEALVLDSSALAGVTEAGEPE